MSDNYMTTLLPSLVTKINHYIDTQNPVDFEQIITQIKTFFTSEYVQLWQYHHKEETFSPFGINDMTTVAIHKGLTYQALLDRQPLVCNHLSSNKNFVQEIDNPLNLKVRALMIHPIVDTQGEIRGYLKLWKGLQQQKVFTEHDKTQMKSLTPLLLSLLHHKKIEISQFQNKSTAKDKQKKEIKNRKNTQQTLIQSRNDNTNIKVQEEKNLHLSKQIASLQEKLDNIEAARKKEKEYITHLESRLKEKPSFDEYTKVTHEKEELQQKFISLKEQLAVQIEEKEKQQRQLKALQFEHDTLKQSAEEITTEILHYQKMLKEHKTYVHALKQENSVLQHQLEKLEKRQKEPHKTDPSAKTPQPKTIKNPIQTPIHNIESILPRYSSIFGKHQYAYILYEMITYTLHAPKQIQEIDDLIQKSKIIPKMLTSYTFTQALKPKEEKASVTEVLTQLEKHWNTLYANRPRLIMQISQQIPPTLIIDEIKLYNILLHILTEIQPLVKEDQSIVLHAKYQNKILYIDIKGSAPKKSRLLSILKQDLSKTKQALGFVLGKHLVHMLKGSLSIYLEERHYCLSLKFPVNIIEL